MTDLIATVERERDRDEFIRSGFKLLRLPAMSDHYSDVLERNVDYTCMSIGEILEEFITEELARRKDKATERRLRDARLWYPHADVNDISYEGKKVTRQQVLNLCRCSFIDAKAFVLITGSPRSGTTFLGCALGASSCRLKYRTLYVRYFDLLQEMSSARREPENLQEKLQQFKEAECLIIDDWMNADVSHNELVILREILDYRSKFGGTILISHTKVDLWKTRMVSETSYRTSLFETITKGATILEVN